VARRSATTVAEASAEAAYKEDAAEVSRDAPCDLAAAQGSIFDGVGYLTAVRTKRER
jgi:hypothetical protein